MNDLGHLIETAPASQQQTVRPEDGMESWLRRYVTEILAGRPFDPIRKLIDALGSSQDAIENQAFSALVAIAQGRPVPSAERHPRTIAVLRRDGVAFQQNGIWKIPGELIRAEILSKSPVARESGAAPTALSNRSAAPNRLEAEGPAFAVLPDGQSPRSRGTLVFATGDGSQTLVLSGIQWALFQQLYTARGTVVGLEQLARSVEKTVPAVRSAIHRLKKSFSAAHHGELIRNVRGGGYEFRATDGSGDRGA